jgi:acetyltransferase
MNPISNFFYPKSICLVGASSKEKSIGYEILKSIKFYGYKGKVFPVNPNAKFILDYKCFPSIKYISEAIDLAIVVVPKQFVEESIDALLYNNVRSIILITAGFKEVGKDGEELEKRILEKIKMAGAKLIGPNCMGIINTLEDIKLNATFVAEKPEIGTIGFLSQSGALGAAVLNSLRETNIKFAHFISAGNKADINENDLLHFWQTDNNIKTMAFYLESFENGKSFIRPFAENRITKPVIVLKAGKTQSGMKAASSHTGAISSNDKIVNSLLKQFGITRAKNLNDLFNTTKGFENFPLPKGNRIAVVTNAGGPAVLCVDKIEEKGLALASYSKETKRKLREIVHPEGSIENPVDLLPGGNAETFKLVNEIAAQDKNVDAVISIFVEPVMVSPLEVVENINSIISNKPILQVVMPRPEFWEYYKQNSKSKTPLFKNPEDPAEVLSNMLNYSRSRKKISSAHIEYKNIFEQSEQKKISINSGFLRQENIDKVCKRYKIPYVKNKFVDYSELKNINRKFFPAVIKGIHQEAIHKSELGAVKLNIKSKKELLAAAGTIKNNFRKAGLEVEKFLVQKFIKAKHELLVGGFKDDSFGPIIMFGSGGKYVEIFDDASIRSCYSCDKDIDEMIAETKIGRILHGVRGEQPSDLTALIQILKSCALMLIENPQISELDINPLIVTEKNKFAAVDVRIKVI